MVIHRPLLLCGIHLLQVSDTGTASAHTHVLLRREIWDSRVHDVQKYGKANRDLKVNRCAVLHIYQYVSARSGRADRQWTGDYLPLDSANFDILKRDHTVVALDTNSAARELSEIRIG